MLNSRGARPRVILSSPSLQYVMNMSRNHAGAGQADAVGIEYLDGLYSYALILTRNHAGSRGPGTEDLHSRDTLEHFAYDPA